MAGAVRRASARTSAFGRSKSFRTSCAWNVVISSNVPLRQDGLPYASQAGKRYDDPGVAVYFGLKGKALSMARDRFYSPRENIRSLILAINVTRSIERHGGNTMERAFSGFAAIAPRAWQAGRRPRVLHPAHQRCRPRSQR